VNQRALILPVSQQAQYSPAAPARPAVNQRALILPVSQQAQYSPAAPTRPPVNQRALILPAAPTRPPVNQRALITREKPELITYLKGKAKSEALVCLLSVLNKLDNKENIFIPEENTIDDLISEGISETFDLTSMLLQFSHLA
jgi:hypothetical protein